MRTYLDTSALISLVIEDAFSGTAFALFQNDIGTVLISDLAALELVCALGRRVRTRELSSRERDQAIADFDALRGEAGPGIALAPDDFRLADGWLRRLNLPLRAPDALHLAVARRESAKLLTFGVVMGQAASALGIPTLA